MKKRALILSILLTLSSIATACGSNGTTEQTEMQINAENENFSQYVTLGEYKGLSSGVTLKKVTDEAIDEVIEETVDAAGGYFEEDKTAAVAEGNQVEVTIQLVDNTTNSDPSSLTFTVGDENYPEEFSNGIIGLKAGDSTTVTLAESETQYIISVNKVSVPADITDEYVETLGIENVSTVKELRDDITEFLRKQYENEYNESVQEAVSKLVVENSEVSEIPEELIDEYTEIINKKVNVILENALETAGEGEEVSLADVLEDQINADGFVGTADEYLKWYAEKNAREYMIYHEIAKIEGISVSEDELYSAIASDWASSQGEYETLVDYIEGYGKVQYEKALLSRKVIKYIAENSEEGIIEESDESSTDESKTEASEESSEGASNE